MTLNLVRAAAAALAIAVAASAPTQAQDLPFNFQMTTPDGFGISMGNGGIGIQMPGMGRNGFQPGRHRTRCLNSNGVADLIEDSGYDDVQVAGKQNGIYYALAYRGYRSYAIAVDPCEGEILGAKRFHEASNY